MANGRQVVMFGVAFTEEQPGLLRTADVRLHLEPVARSYHEARGDAARARQDATRLRQALALTADAVAESARAGERLYARDAGSAGREQQTITRLRLDDLERRADALLRTHADADADDAMAAIEVVRQVVARLATLLDLASESGTGSTGDGAVDRLASAVTEPLPASAADSAGLALSVSPVPSFRALIDLRSALARLPGEARADVLEYRPEMGQARFAVYGIAADALIAAIVDRFPGGSAARVGDGVSLHLDGAH